MKFRPTGPITLSTDLKDIAVLVAIGLFILFLGAGCRTTSREARPLPVTVIEEPPLSIMPPLPPGYEPPPKQRMMAPELPEPLIALPSPLRIRYPAFPGHRQWNPALGRSVTTTNKGLYGFEWVAPIQGERWYLHSSTNLIDWSEGIPVGDRYQGVHPFSEDQLFFKVVPSEE